MNPKMLVFSLYYLSILILSLFIYLHSRFIIKDFETRAESSGLKPTVSKNRSSNAEFQTISNKFLIKMPHLEKIIAKNCDNCFNMNSSADEKIESMKILSNRFNESFYDLTAFILRNTENKTEFNNTFECFFNETVQKEKMAEIKVDDFLDLFKYHNSIRFTNKSENILKSQNLKYMNTILEHTKELYNKQNSIYEYLNQLSSNLKMIVLPIVYNGCLGIMTRKNLFQIKNSSYSIENFCIDRSLYQIKIFFENLNLKSMEIKYENIYNDINVKIAERRENKFLIEIIEIKNTTETLDFGPFCKQFVSDYKYSGFSSLEVPFRLGFKKYLPKKFKTIFSFINHINGFLKRNLEIILYISDMESIEIQIFLRNIFQYEENLMRSEFIDGYNFLQTISNIRQEKYTKKECSRQKLRLPLLKYVDTSWNEFSIILKFLEILLPNQGFQPFDKFCIDEYFMYACTGDFSMNLSVEIQPFIEEVNMKKQEKLTIQSENLNSCKKLIDRKTTVFFYNEFQDFSYSGYNFFLYLTIKGFCDKRSFFPTDKIFGKCELYYT